MTTPRPRVSAEDLERWADRYEAAAVLPELVRRLLLATVPLRELEMRAGKAVGLGGFDGTVVAREETAFCPEGNSVWELSTRADVRKKLDEDYGERSKKSGIVDPRRVSFTLVTARRFPAKTKWIERSNEDRRWRRVRVLDADDLAAWLEQAPMVTAWFSHVHLERPAYDLCDAESYMRRWSQQTTPPLPLSLLLAGRDSERRLVEQWLEQARAGYGARVLRVAATSRDEARMFVLATIDQLPPAQRELWVARCTLVESTEAWRWAVHSTGQSSSQHTSSPPALLIPTFEDDDTITGVADPFALAVLPLERGRPAPRDTITLDEPLPWREVEVELRRLGKQPIEAERIAHETLGDLSALRAKLGYDAIPAWVGEDPAALVVMMLVGAWTPTHSVDAHTIRTLGVEPRHLDQVCGMLANADKAPLEQVDGVWKWRSHSVAWQQLRKLLTPAHRDVFAEVAGDVLGDDESNQRRCSSPMEEGVATSLGYLSQLEEDRGAGAGAEIASSVVRRVLTPGWSQWASLGERLSDLAEAAPSAFLDALENSLDHREEGVDILAIERETAAPWGLLRALQTLAWERRYVGRSVTILARLAAYSPDGPAAERPLASLYAIFNTFYPQTRLDDSGRMELLRALVGQFPTRGWQLLLEILHYSLQGDVVHPSPRPRIRSNDGIPMEPPALTAADRNRRIEAMVEIILDTVGVAPERWKDLLAQRIYRFLGPSPWKKVLDVLEERRGEILALDTRNHVWHALMHDLSEMYLLADRHGIDLGERLSEVERQYRAFEPTNLVLRHAWTFYNGDTLPEPGLRKTREDVQARLEELRDEALEALLSTHEALGNLTALIEQLPSEDGIYSPLDNVAKALARSRFRPEFQTLLLEDIPSSEHRALMPHFAFWTYLAENGPRLTWLEELLEAWVANDRAEEALGVVRRLGSPEIWDMLDRLGDPLRAAYWRSLEVVPGDETTPWERVVSSLLESGNIRVAAQTAAYRAKHIRTCTLIRLLEAASSWARSNVVEDKNRFLHDVEDLFSALDERHTNGEGSGESADALASLELDLLEWLDYHSSRRPLRYVPARLEASAKEFTLFICRIFAPENEDNVYEPGEAKPYRHALHMWKSYPGSDLSDADAREATLLEWATEALRLTAASGRQRAGVTEVAKVLARAGQAEDGHWPSLASRKLIESNQYRALGRELRTAQEQGSHSTAWWVSDGGREDHELADRYEASATAIRARWPATAAMLDDLAECHRQEAVRRDDAARRERLAHGVATSTSLDTRSVPQEQEMTPNSSETDALPGTIHHVEIIDVGPATRLAFDLAPRLNLIAGNNGLGKTFLLDVLWWCFTGTWTEQSEAWPSLEAREREPKIRVTNGNGEESSSVFDRTNETWPRPTGWPALLAPVLYSRPDGCFALWDPLRNRGAGAPPAYHFKSPWDRLVDASGTVLCFGLVDDWRDWAQRSDKSLFDKFFAVVKALVPEGEELEPAEVIKLSKRSASRVPQVRLRYGDVPIVHLSAGMKRVLSIAYLLIWAWDEHLQAARLEGTAPANQIVLLLDEVETHLHPKWQRMLLPALLEAAKGLSQDPLSVQVVATTHSPLVAASLEAHFDQDRDQLLHLGFEGNEVRIREIPWAPYGDASAWLESPVFDLEHATAKELEHVLAAADAFLANQPLPADLDTRDKIDYQLHRFLPTMHPFWLQWGRPLDEASQ